VLPFDGDDLAGRTGGDVLDKPAMRSSAAPSPIRWPAWSMVAARPW
jgi:hypothetical protein